jgi:hypothetical protein
MEQRERERELEAVDRIIGIQRGQEITAREKGRVLYISQAAGALLLARWIH